MSRIGQQPVDVPDEVDLNLSGTTLRLEGPNGEIEREIHPDMEIEEESDQVLVKNNGNSREHEAIHGTTRSLIANMIEGVTDGFSKTLEIHGTGYRAMLQGDTLVVEVGYTEDVEVDVPEELDVEVPKDKEIQVSGVNKEKVGQFAAEIRAIRPPEPYNQKGIRYKGEQVRSKEGKKFVSGV